MSKWDWIAFACLSALAIVGAVFIYLVVTTVAQTDIPQWIEKTWLSFVGGIL